MSLISQIIFSKPLFMPSWSLLVVFGNTTDFPGVTDSLTTRDIRGLLGRPSLLG